MLAQSHIQVFNVFKPTIHQLPRNILISEVSLSFQNQSIHLLIQWVDYVELRWVLRIINEQNAQAPITPPLVTSIID